VIGTKPKLDLVADRRVFLADRQIWAEMAVAFSQARSRPAVLQTLSKYFLRFNYNLIISDVELRSRSLAPALVGVPPQHLFFSPRSQNDVSSFEGEAVSLDGLELYDRLLDQTSPQFVNLPADVVHRLLPSDANVLLAQGEGQVGIATQLRTGDSVDYLLYLFADDLTGDDLELVAAVAELASAALASARVLEEAEMQRAVAETLQRVGGLVNASLDLNTVLSQILEQLATVVSYDSSSILLEENEELRLVAGRGFRDDLLEVLKIAVPIRENPLYREIRRSKEPVYIGDVRLDKRYVRWAGSDPVRSWIGLPLTYKDTIIGQIAIDSHQPNAYTPSHVNLAFALAQQVAVAIENARLHEQTQQKTVELRALLDSGRDISSTLNKKQVLRLIARRSKELLEARSISIYLLQADGKTLEAEVALGDPAEESQATTVMIGQGVTGTAAATGQGIIVESIANSPSPKQSRRRTPINASLISIPLRVKGEISGAVTLSRSSDRPFQPADLDLLERFALQAAIAVENAELYQSVERRLRETSAILETSAAFAKTLDFDEVLATLVQQASLASDAGCAAFFRPKKRGSEDLNIQVNYGLPESYVDRVIVPAGVGPIGRAFQEKVTCYVDDIEHEANFGPCCQLALEHGFCAIASLPLLLKGESFGVLAVYIREQRQFNEHTLDFLKILLNQTTVALENAVQVRRTAQALRETQALYRAGRALAETAEMQDMLERALGEYLQALGLRQGGVLFIEPDGETGVLHALYRDGEPQLPGLRLEIVGAHRLVFETGKPVAIPDAANDPLMASQQGITQAHHIKSILMVPLLAGGRVIGILGADATEAIHHFSEREITLAQAMADQIATAIENRRLYGEVQEYAATLERRIEERTADIRREKERTAAILESAADAIVFTDKDGVIEYINPAFTELTGFTLEEAKGEMPNILRSKQTSLEVYKDMWETIRSGQVWRDEIQNRRKDGTLYDAELAIAPMHDDDGRVINFIGIQRDITKSRELERMKDEFLATAAHELRGPLTTVRGYTELLLLRDDISDAESHQFLSYINEQSVNLTKLVSDLLDLARIKSGDIFKIVPEPTDVRPLVLDLLEQWRTKAPHCFFSLLGPDEWPILDVDRTRLQQVLENLLSNAVKYSPAGGRITLEAVRKPANIRVSVTDQGIGMSQDEQSHLFEKFWRANSTSTAVEGIGLGLAVVKTIIEAHGGRVWVLSEPGHGTTVSFNLPLNSRVPTVLVIEDEQGVREVEQRILNAAGIQTLEAATGTQGLELARMEQPDLIVLDLMLPDMSGETILRKIQGKPATRGIPVVVVSALSAISHIEDTYALGAIDFITKPFDFDEFLGRVRLALKARIGERP
jgi:PAS domain S-box-containing protein